MADEVRVICSLQINKGTLVANPQPTTFTADMNGKKGPSPGAIDVPITGINADLSQLVTPGFCRLWNLDEDNFVEYGIYVTALSLFVPFGELGPGRGTVVELSRNLLEGYTNAGTGTTGDVNGLHFKANGATCVVVIEAFEK